MDNIDLHILKRIMENPTEPFLRIAEEIGISPITVQKRYEKMKNRAIYPPFIIIDLTKIGYQGKAYLMVTNSSEFDSKLTVEALDQIPNVFLIAETVGKFDVIALAVFKDIKDIKEIVKKLRAEPSVKRVEVALTEETDFPLKRDVDSLQLFEHESAERLMTLKI